MSARMIGEVEGKRAYTARQVERWAKRGDITHEQAEVLRADMEAHLEDVDPCPALNPGLVPIYDAWRQMGRPATVIQGLAGGLLDFRAQLYPARVAWLDEHLYRHPDDREVAMSLWSTMDETEISLMLEAAREAAET